MADVATRSEGLRASALSVKLEIGLTANDWKLEIILDVEDEALVASVKTSTMEICSTIGVSGVESWSGASGTVVMVG